MSPEDVLLAAGACALVAAVWFGPMALRVVGQRRLAAECRRERALVLTYDDGPGEVTTRRLLDLLAAHGARASFFLLGRNAERHAELADAAVRAGHEVGSHSYRHVHPWKSLPWDPPRDVAAGLRSLSRWIRPGALFRPPHGKLTLASWVAARCGGARLAWWTRDSRDSWERLPAPEDVVAEVRASGGAVVLMHDIDRDAARDAYVLELTERLLEMARAEGLRVMTLGELRSASGRS